MNLNKIENITIDNKTQINTHVEQLQSENIKMQDTPKKVTQELIDKKTKTRGQLISKLQHMKNGVNSNLVRHIAKKDIDSICSYLLEDKHLIEELEKSLETQKMFVNAYKKENQKLQKALEKACIYLENIDNRCAYFEGEYYLAIGHDVKEKSETTIKKEWKEILMKDD